MLGNILPPYHSLQELNLDWILTKVKDMLRFLPDDGSVGQILRRTAHGAEWSNEQGGGGAVNSVNGQTGDVVLTATDVGALPDTTPIPTDTSDLTNTAGFVDAAGAAAAAPVQSVNGQTGAVTITAPVTSVNGQTGAVSLTIPTDTADLTNTAGFVDAAGAAAAAPVQSVNGQTGAVTISTGGRTLLWTNPAPSSSFAPQTIILPSHSHSAYQIICKFRYNADYTLGPFEGLVGEQVIMNSPACSNIISGSFTGFILRLATTAAGQIAFGTGEIAYTTGTTNNDYMIPIRVYGID